MAAHSAIDANCTRTNVKFNDGFSTVWTAPGMGYVNWRLYANLQVYDQCDHGGIQGTVAVYDAAVKKKEGATGIGLLYARSTEGKWRSELLRLNQYAKGNGWTYYSVSTDNNIGMSRNTYLSSIKMNSYLTFNKVPGAPRREECVRSANTWKCDGKIGM